MLSRNMSKRRTQPIAPKLSSQEGVALVVILLFLVAITGLTVWAARQSMLGEGMARNQLELEVARQAAESALRDAERDLMNMTASTLTNASCTRGRARPPIASDFSDLCVLGMCLRSETAYASSSWQAGSAATAANSEPWWPTGKGGQWNNIFDDKPNRAATSLDTSHCVFNGAVPLGTFTGVPPIRGVANQPEYIIEYFVRSSNITYQPTNTYRITARGFGYLRRTQVVLQSYFVPLQD